VLLITLAAWSRVPEGEAVTRHLVGLVARHAAVLAWKRSLRAACAGPPRAIFEVEQAFRRLWCDLFAETLISIEDPGVSGDQIVNAVAAACPPGFRARILGMQNIKGAGLDFAYRWLIWERTARTLAALERSRGAEALPLAESLAAAEDLGILDLSAAEETVRRAAAREEENSRPLERLAEQLAQRRMARARDLEVAPGTERSTVRAGLDELLELWHGVLRRRRAARIVEGLCRGQISHRRAAEETRTLIRGEKTRAAAKIRGPRS
jgi:hypothetical protein